MHSIANEIPDSSNVDTYVIDTHLSDTYVFSKKLHSSHLFNTVENFLSVDTPRKSTSLHHHQVHQPIDTVQNNVPIDTVHKLSLSDTTQPCVSSDSSDSPHNISFESTRNADVSYLSRSQNLLQTQGNNVNYSISITSIDNYSIIPPPNINIPPPNYSYISYLNVNTDNRKQHEISCTSSNINQYFNNSLPDIESPLLPIKPKCTHQHKIRHIHQKQKSRNPNNLITLTKKNQNKSVVIYYQNVKGLRSKLKNLKCGIATRDVDIYSLAETWLTDKKDIKDNELGFNNYIVYRTNRSLENSKKSDGGGVLLAVRKSIPSYHIQTRNEKSESVFVHCNIGSTKLIIGTTYLPPGNTNITAAHFIEALEEVLSKFDKHKIILLGDFNLPNLAWVFENETIHHKGNHTPLSRNITSILCEFHNLTQFNLVKNQMDRTLDLIFSNMCNTEIRVDQNLDPLPLKIDPLHPPLDISLNLPHHNNGKCFHEETKLKVLLYKKGDYSSLTRALHQVNWTCELDQQENLELAVTRFYSILGDLTKKHVPIKEIKNFKFPVWVTPELKNLILQKKIIHKFFKQTGQLELKHQFNVLRTKCKELSAKNYNSYIHSTEKELHQNPAKFWSYIKNNKKDTGLPSVMSYNGETSSDGQHIANLFAKNLSSVYSNEVIVPPHFSFQKTLITPLQNITIDEKTLSKGMKKLKQDSTCGPDNIPPILLKNCAPALLSPLLILFNWSLSTGIYPEQWKKSYVIPIHKSGKKSDIENYRPISKLSSIPKLFESLVYKQIFPILMPMISDNQHGFVYKKSTTTNLLSFTRNVADVLNRGTQFDTVITDYSKAFDKINVNILCSKLKAYGIEDPLLTWFYNYFSHRIQSVQFRTNQNGKNKCLCNISSISSIYLSEPFIALSGCPQGGHLSGLAFNLYINDVSDYLSTPFWLFADDKKISLEIRNENDATELQRSLNGLYQWCVINRMDLNINKCKVITFHTIKNPIIYQYSINNINLQRITEIKDLGVFFNSQLSFNQHIENITAKAFKILGFINRNSKDFKNPNTYKILYYTFIRSILEYASSVWSPYYKQYINQIESVQHAFLRSLAYKQKNPVLDHDYHDIMVTNDIPTLEQRRNTIDILLLYKILNNKVILPEFLNNIYLRVNPKSTRNTRLFHENLCSTNYMFHQPLNRMLRSYNHTTDKYPLIDIFYDSYNIFRDKVSDSMKITS